MKNIILSILILFSLSYASESNPTYEEVAKLYVATFNRAPDSAGLDYWINDSGLTLSQIAQSFFDQPETQALYPPSTTNRDFVEAVYQNLFNREPDIGGWNYWENELNEHRYSKNLFIQTVINGAKDSADGMDKTILNNKTETGLYFALYGNEDKSLANSIMQTITSDSNTVAQAKDTFYTNSGISADDVCIVDMMYFDKSTPFTLCYEGVSKDSCEQSVGSDYESYWYGFPLKGECIDLGYPESSQTLSNNNNYVFYGMSGLFSPKIGSGDIISTTITEDNLIAQNGKVKISFSSNDIDSSKTLTIQQTTPKKLPSDEEVDDEYQVKSYDFALDGKTDFIDLVEITIPYDQDFIETVGDESGSVMAMYYNPTLKQYEPVDYQVDTQKHEVKILTNHLSEYAVFTSARGVRHGAFKVVNSGTRRAYITATDAYYKFVTSNTAVNIINNSIANNMVGVDQAYEAGFNKANEWLGLMAAGNGLASAPFSSSFLTSLGNSFNAIGVGASVLQAAFDFTNGDIVSLYSNLSKNTVYNAVNYFGTSALQLAFVGVFAIDYSLSAFANEAWDGSNKKWYETYKQCYRKHFYKRPKEWYKTFYWIWHDARDLQQTKEKISKAIDDNVFAVWDELSGSDMVECMNDLGYENLGGSNTSLEITLAMAKRSELVAALQPVFDRLEKRIIWDIRAKHKEKLEEIRKALNQVIHVDIKETVEAGKTASYAGYKFRFSPLNSSANKAEWTGTLDSSGSATGAWRVLGYMQAGSPNRLELFKPTDNPDTAAPVKTVEFKITPPNLVINFESSGDTKKTFSGTRESTYRVKYSDLTVETTIDWSIRSNTNVTVNEPIIYIDDKPVNVDDDGGISLWFSTKWTSDINPSGTFNITMRHNISGSVPDECVMGRPYYELGVSGSEGTFGGHEPTFNFQLNDTTINGNYEFTSGGNTAYINWKLRIPMKCGEDQDTEVLFGPDLYMKIEN